VIFSQTCTFIINFLNFGWKASEMFILFVVYQFLYRLKQKEDPREEIARGDNIPNLDSLDDGYRK